MSNVNFVRRRITTSPYVSSLLLWFVFSLTLFVIMLSEVPLPWLVELIMALNMGTFMIYGLDKIFAVSRTMRVPEKVLWFTAFAGGPLGALLGMQMFRHKVSKKSFQFVLALVVLAEVALIIFVLDKADIDIHL